MAETELNDLKLENENNEKKLKLFLLPKDEADKKNAIIEIRAGTGGLEASLFAADLFKMYEKVSHKKQWIIDLISISKSEAGGLKEEIASVKGNNIYSTLKYESGVHRVQRITDTETQGRVHTSAATVAVLPEVEEVDLSMRLTYELMSLELGAPEGNQLIPQIAPRIIRFNWNFGFTTR